MRVAMPPLNRVLQGKKQEQLMSIHGSIQHTFVPWQQPGLQQVWTGMGPQVLAGLKGHAAEATWLQRWRVMVAPAAGQSPEHHI
jgi:hypothetical protein